MAPAPALLPVEVLARNRYAKEYWSENIGEAVSVGSVSWKIKSSEHTIYCEHARAPFLLRIGPFRTEKSTLHAPKSSTFSCLIAINPNARR